MVELADIIRRAGDAYRRAFHGRIPSSHLRAIADIVRCRTPALGGSVYACDDCGTTDYAYHSGRNRHCPTCQDDRAPSWLDRLRGRLLPSDQYRLTFTLPSELRGLARSNQRLVYAILMREAAATVLTLADDPQWIGGRPAILAALHTGSRALAYHPHVHLLVSAGGLSPDGSAWVRPTHARFLFPGYTLSSIFRAKVLAALAKARLAQHVCPDLSRTPWTVHVQRIGSGEHAAPYLSRYVYRVALTNDRIERFEHGHVTFRYTDARTRQIRRMTLPVLDFIARFLQHVLPRGFPGASPRSATTACSPPVPAPTSNGPATCWNRAPSAPPCHPRRSPTRPPSLRPASSPTPRTLPPPSASVRSAGAAASASSTSSPLRGAPP